MTNWKHVGIGVVVMLIGILMIQGAKTSGNAGDKYKSMIETRAVTREYFMGKERTFYTYLPKYNIYSHNGEKIKTELVGGVIFFAGFGLAAYEIIMNIDFGKKRTG